jgi:hypothetical protein
MAAGGRWRCYRRHCSVVPPRDVDPSAVVLRRQGHPVVLAGLRCPWEYVTDAVAFTRCYVYGEPRS